MSLVGNALNNWLQRQGASVMRQEVSPCLPMNRVLWREKYPSFVKEWGNKKVRCIEDYLNEYIALAEAERATDEQLEELRVKTANALKNAILMEHGFFLDFPLDTLLGELELLKQGKPSKWEDEFENTLAATKLLEEISLAFFKTERAETRMDKLEAIEKFVSLTHGGGGPLLTHGCEIIDMDVDDATVDVLNCLAGEKK